MSTKVETPSSSMDSLKWLLTFAFLGGAVVGNFMFEDMSVLIRAVGVVAAVAIGLGIASQTGKGKDFIVFAKEARIEVRKVVWPTRQESTQTTFIVMIATVVMALILYAIDGGLFWLVSKLTSLGV